MARYQKTKAVVEAELHALQSSARGPFGEQGVPGPEDTERKARRVASATRVLSHTEKLKEEELDKQKIAELMHLLELKNEEIF